MPHEIESRADSIGHDGRNAADHRLVHRQSVRLVLRRMHEQVAARVDGGKLRVLHETEEASALLDSESTRFPLEVCAQRSVTDENQERIGDICAGEGLQKIRCSLARDELSAEDDGNRIARDVPRVPDLIPIRRRRSACNRLVVDDIRCEEHTLFAGS